MITQHVAEQLTTAARALREYPTTTDALRLPQVVQNAIDAAKVDLVAEMAEHGDHEAEGCSSVKNWLRDQLHLDTKDASQLTRSARTLTDMPELADLATAGAVSLDHNGAIARGA